MLTHTQDIRAKVDDIRMKAATKQIDEEWEMVEKDEDWEEVSKEEADDKQEAVAPSGLKTTRVRGGLQ